MNWTDQFSEDELRAAGLLPEQMRERFTGQLARLSTYRKTAEGEQLKGSLRAALGIIAKSTK